MKKSLLLILAAAMALQGLSAMAEDKFKPAETYERDLRRFHWGPIAMEKLEADSDTISQERYAGNAVGDYSDKRDYTYRSAIIGDEGLNWNPQRCLTDDERMLAELLSPGLYGFFPDSSRTGWAILPELAAEMPVDITAEYNGQMGIAAGETGRAWRIALNREARWCLSDNAISWLQLQGDSASPDLEITADDYIYSLRQLLNPRLNNPSAARFCEKGFTLYNALRYRESGQTTYEPLETTAEEALASGLSLSLDMDFWSLTGAPDAHGKTAPKYVPIDDDTLYRDDEGAWLSARELFDSYLAAGKPYESYQREYIRVARTAPDTTWDDLGIRKIDDYTLDLIFEEPVKDAAWRLPYALREGFLIFRPLFEACKTYYDEEGREIKSEAEAFSINSDYGTSVNKTASCGPYAITDLKKAKSISLKRNEGWYGYRDGLHKGMYQTDVVEIALLSDHAEAMEVFRQGGLDAVVLSPEEVGQSADSPSIMYLPEIQTTKLTLNTDYDKLLSRNGNSQLLAVDEFREAIAWAIDREQLAGICGGQPAYGLLASSYICDPYTGNAYRDTESGQKAVAAGPVHDLAKARSLMQLAYDRAVAAGIYNGLSPISIVIRVEQEDERSQQVFNAIDSQVHKAIQGTALEPHLKLRMVADAHCYETNYGGDADVVFTTWSGSPMDPYAIMGTCYTDSPDGSGLQMEYGYNTGVISLTIDCDGQDVTASLRGWARWARGDVMTELDEALGHFSDYSYETRSAILSGMEACFLHWNPTIPLYESCKAVLLSARFTPAVKPASNPVIRDGGLAFATYRYDDETWAKLVQQTDAH